MKNFIKRNKKHIIYIGLIIIIGLILSIPLLNEKLNVLRDDGVQHIIRIKETAECIKNLESTKIYNNLCNGFGYSWDIFYGNFTSFIPATIYLIVGSEITAFKIFLSLLLILSGISMYISTYKMFKKHEISIIASVIYMCAPYHLNDLYMRYSVGEFASFIFIPLVFAGLHSIIKNKEESNIISIENDIERENKIENESKIKTKKYNKHKNNDFIMLIIGAVGLIITHILSTVITAIFAVIYLLINFKELKNIQKIKKILLSLLLILMISSYFWIPMFENTLNTKYEVYEENKMSTVESVNAQRVDFKDLISNKDNFQIHEIGLVTIALVILTLYSIRKVDKENKKIFITFLVFGILSILMTTKLIDWSGVPESFLIIQFPWRMLEFSTYFLSIVASISFCSTIKNVRLIDVLYIVIITVLLTAIFKDRLDYSEEKVENPSIGIVHENSRYGTNAGAAKFEYLPKKAYDNLEYIAQRQDLIYVLSGSANIEDEEKNVKTLKATIKCNSDNLVLELPYIYYLGYSAYVDGEKVDIYESENGFLMLSLNTENKDTINLEVKYTGTVLDNLSKIISITGICLLLFILIKSKNREKKITNNLAKER